MWLSGGDAGGIADGPRDAQIQVAAADGVELGCRVVARPTLDSFAEAGVLGQPDQVRPNLFGLVAVDLHLERGIVRDLRERTEVVHDRGPPLRERARDGPGRLP